jgi:integrase
LRPARKWKIETGSVLPKVASRKELSVASIFKLGGRKNRKSCYWVEYIDYDGTRRRKKGFTDKGLTEQLAAKLENEVMMRRRGMLDPQAEKLAEQRQLPLKDHLAAFRASMVQRLTTEKHVKLTMSRVQAVVTGCEATTLVDLQSEKVQAYLHELSQDADLGPRTYNHYVQAVDAFCKWLVRSGRSAANPLVGLSRLNAEVDIRHKRRALTQEEVKSLINSANESEKRIQGLTGVERARVYLMSFLTGLRRGELGSLTPQSFDLDSEEPTLTIAAASSKHRREDVLPIHPEFVETLREWLCGMKRTDKLFPGLEKKKTWYMVKKDLERAGIAYETDAGIADFHAAGRHTHITELLRNGATLPEARELARHCDVRQTMKYTHIGLRDQRRALSSLPSPVEKKQDAKPTGQHSSQYSSGPTGQTEASRDTASHKTEKSNRMLKSERETTCDTLGHSQAACGNSAKKRVTGFDSRRLHFVTR